MADSESTAADLDLHIIRVWRSFDGPSSRMSIPLRRFAYAMRQEGAAEAKAGLLDTLKQAHVVLEALHRSVERELAPEIKAYIAQAAPAAQAAIERAEAQAYDAIR